MKANLIYRGPDGRKDSKAQKLHAGYDVETETGFIVLEAGGKQVVYRDWNDFHSRVAGVEVLDAAPARGQGQ
jgi:hypothetical protein